jgi:outer membrane biosynthesis protein TonB
MLERTSLPRVSQIKSTTAVSDLDAFDMMSRFLASQKAKQLSLDFAGQSYLASSTQTWNDLRLSCNSLLEDNDPRREPVVEWKDERSLDETPASPNDDIETSMTTTTPATVKSEKLDKKSAKKEKKEAKKEKKEAKKVKKEAKKVKKEIKKRKRESLEN